MFRMSYFKMLTDMTRIYTNTGKLRKQLSFHSLVSSADYDDL